MVGLLATLVRIYPRMVECGHGEKIGKILGLIDVRAAVDWRRVKDMETEKAAMERRIVELEAEVENLKSGGGVVLPF